MCASLMSRLHLFVLHPYLTKDGVASEIANGTRHKINAVSFFLVSILVRKTTYGTSNDRDDNDGGDDIYIYIYIYIYNGTCILYIIYK